MDPTATLPKVTAGGLTLRVPEVAEVPEVVVSEFVAVVELPLALVTPEQPLRNAPNTTMMKAAKIRDDLRQLRLERVAQTHE